MNDRVLLELAAKWEREARPPDVEDGSETAKLGNATDAGMRIAMRNCSRQLRELVDLLGGEENV